MLTNKGFFKSFLPSITLSPYYGWYLKGIDDCFYSDSPGEVVVYGANPRGDCVLEQDYVIPAFHAGTAELSITYRYEGFIPPVLSLTNTAGDSYDVPLGITWSQEYRTITVSEPELGTALFFGASTLDITLAPRNLFGALFVDEISLTVCPTVTGTASETSGMSIASAWP